MAGTGIKGWSGVTSSGKTVSNGIVQGGSSNGSSSYQLGGFSLSPGGNDYAIANNVYNAATTQPGVYGDYVREMLNYSERNSAFNAAEAAKARQWSAGQNQIAMATSAAEAQKNRDWQEYMSNTSHQREVKDLVAAGLNPVLSGLGGASTPAGSAGNGYTNSASSASADTSASTLSGLFGTILSNAAALQMQDKTLAWNAEQLQMQKYFNELAASTDLAVSRNSLLGSQAIAGSNLQAARLGNEASHYSSDINNAINAANRENALEIARLQEQGKMDRDLSGSVLQGVRESLTSGDNPIAVGLNKALEVKSKFDKYNDDYVKWKERTFPSGGGASRSF